MRHLKHFDFWDPEYAISEKDKEIAHRYLGSLTVPADLVIAPLGKPYIWRWELVRGLEASIYFHIQIADDPDRPLHDHPWDNMSVILAGGYTEILAQEPALASREFARAPGDVIFRKATWAHRLLMPAGVKYTMTQFSTGPRLREWGFWTPSGWRQADDVMVTKDGFAVTRDA